jgi:hypothetical protein
VQLADPSSGDQQAAHLVVCQQLVQLHALAIQLLEQPVAALLERHKLAHEQLNLLLQQRFGLTRGIRPPHPRPPTSSRCCQVAASWLHVSHLGRKLARPPLRRCCRTAVPHGRVLVLWLLACGRELLLQLADLGIRPLCICARLLHSLLERHVPCGSCVKLQPTGAHPPVARCRCRAAASAQGPLLLRRWPYRCQLLPQLLCLLLCPQLLLLCVSHLGLQEPQLHTGSTPHAHAGGSGGTAWHVGALTRETPHAHSAGTTISRGCNSTACGCCV